MMMIYVILMEMGSDEVFSLMMVVMMETDDESKVERKLRKKGSV